MEKFLEMMRQQELEWLQGVANWKCREMYDDTDTSKRRREVCERNATDWMALREWCEGMQQQLSAAEQRAKDAEAVIAVLKSCVELYADPTNWSDNTYYLFKACLRGCEPAQAALAKVDGMGGNSGNS